MVKIGGVSWNTSVKSKTGVKTRFKCKYCSRSYKMDWAKNNHEKICPLKTKNNYKSRKDERKRID